MTYHGDDICGEPNTSKKGVCRNPPTESDDRCWIHSDLRDDKPHGRPSKLDRETQERIAQELEKGMSVQVASVKAGITRATYHRWRAKGRAAAEAGEEGPYRDFFDRTERALAEAEAVWAERAYQFAREAESFGAAMEILRKRFPNSGWSGVSESQGKSRLTVMLSDDREPGDKSKPYRLTPDGHE